MTDVAERLEELRDRGLHRRLRLVAGRRGRGSCSTSKPVLLLCSNNYLGLANHPDVRAAAAEAADALGRRRRRLAADLRQHEAPPRARAAPGGVQGPRGGAALRLRLPGQHGHDRRPRPAGEVVFSDELNHASIIDGCRLSRAETFVYRHRDVEHLAWGLRKARGHASLIVTDGVFSMDGDVAPLEDLARLARDHGCRLMVDEAHATGALGPGGRGSVAAAGLSGEVDVVVGTLGKALGSYGAYVCAEAEVVEYLVNSARSFIFSTAPPPPSIAAAWRRWSCSNPTRARVERLRTNAAVLREALAAEGLAVGDSETQIVPVEVGDAESDDGALRARPPRAASSPRGSARRPCPRAPRACASR